MADEFEAVGTAIEGGLLAGAVEGESAEAASSENGLCLNCKNAVSGKYCSNCGQPLHIHRSINAIWHDILHGVLHFEGKVWRTLPMLAFKPGQLTRRYIAGQRARFVSPMALFLFSIFLMFAVFSFIGSPFSAGEGETESDENIVTRAEQIADELPENIKNLEAELAKAGLSKTQRTVIEQELDGLLDQRNTLAEMNARGIKLEDGALNVEDASISTGSLPVDEFVKNALDNISSNPGLLLYKLKANGYKFAWLLIPLSLPFVWITMIGVRGHRIYDHAVFTTYSISFMSLLFIFIALASVAGVSSGVLTAIVIIAPPLHLYKHLRHSYRLSRFGTIIRLIFLFTGIIASLALFLTSLFLLGILR